MVHRIGIMLRLEAEGAVLFVGLAGFAFGVAQKIGGVKLDAGLIRKHFHCSTGFRLNTARFVPDNEYYAKSVVCRGILQNLIHT